MTNKIILLLAFSLTLIALGNAMDQAPEKSPDGFIQTSPMHDESKDQLELIIQSLLKLMGPDGINQTICNNAFRSNFQDLKNLLLFQPIQNMLRSDAINFTLVCAAWYGNVEIVRVILNHDNLAQKIHSECAYQSFSYAVQQRHTEIVQALVDNTKTSSLLLTHEAKEFEMLDENIDSTSEQTNSLEIKKLLSTYINKEKKVRPKMPIPKKTDTCITS